MGSSFGAFLAKAGQDVCLVDIRKEHIERVRKNGLCLDTDGSHQFIAMKAALNPDEAAHLLGGYADVVLVLVKTTATESVLKGASALIGPDTYLVTVQNGTGSELVLSEFAKPDHVIFGTSAFSASVEVAGTVSYVPRPAWCTHIMPLAGEMNAVCEALAQSLTEGGHPTYADMDTERKQWLKIGTNCIANAASALTRLKSSTIFDNPNGRRYGEIILGEVIAVANAKGLSISMEDMIPYLDQAAALPWYPSMGLDSINHRLTEIDALNGAIVRLGRQYGISTPANEAIYHLVKILEVNYDKLPQTL